MIKHMGNFIRFNLDNFSCNGIGISDSKSSYFFTKFSNVIILENHIDIEEEYKLIDTNDIIKFDMRVDEIMKTMNKHVVITAVEL